MEASSTCFTTPDPTFVMLSSTIRRTVVTGSRPATRRRKRSDRPCPYCRALAGAAPPVEAFSNQVSTCSSSVTSSG